MELPHSNLVDPADYETDGLICDGYQLRVSKYTDLADLGSIRAQQDWSKHVAPTKFYKGTLGDTYDFISLCIPECRPERIEIIAYANEMYFLHDDVVEDSDKGEGDRLNDALLEGFLPEQNLSAKTAMSNETTVPGRQIVQRKLIRAMMAVDRTLALKTMAIWTSFLETGCGRSNHTVFDNFDEFMQYRVLDVGKLYWVGAITFGMGITLSESELDVCYSLCHPMWLSCGLINDLYSWPKERDAAAAQRVGHVNNAVWVLMKEQSVDEAQALVLLRDKIRQCFVDYRAVLLQHGGRLDFSSELRRLLHALSFSMIGHLVWSRTAPRYIYGCGFSERQLRWMKDGTPRSIGVMG
ncbi:isoprenoid synthase domain-containing protein [Cercophora newfieldiana]|uniref:Isoprenoid synthase domain-containing protein n=1 Tax=Cercophora newfieldiana TaxID=92897 RepID=A0AA39XT28_9PEZI|nr:isoprenoid synthase domain-containing protein [Cercophora newfieldiana]